MYASVLAWDRQTGELPIRHWHSPCVDVQNFYQDVEFDGLWLDMDEVSNYCTGDVCQNPGEASFSRLQPLLLCLPHSLAACLEYRRSCLVTGTSLEHMLPESSHGPLA